MFRQRLYQYLKKIEIREHRLSYLFLELTKKCNLSCLHCGTDCKADNKSPELTISSWKKIIDYIHENFGNSVFFVLTGGEPTLYTGFFEIIKYLSSLNLQWGMVTNAFNFNKNLINQLVENKIHSVTVSLDGLKENHNFLRNNRFSFSRVDKALGLISQSDIPKSDVVTCVYPQNLSQLNDIAEYLLLKKVLNWRIFRVFPSGRAHNNPLLALSFEESRQLIMWIFTNKKNFRKRGLNINLSCEGFVDFKLDREIRDVPFFCRAGINIASILCDGSITGCSNNHSSFYQGNILKDNFQKIWQFRFEDFRKRKWISNTNCSQCEYVKECQGGSIHLWELGNKLPNFCYMKKLY